jgi:multidrug transporter EmrE-like cation transporter
MCLNALANLVIKIAVRGRNLMLSPAGFPETLKFLVGNPLIWTGVILFALALFGYSIVLSRVNLSVAYPVMTGGGFLIVFVLSALYLREVLTVSHVGGALLILMGIWLLLK